jgi:hypothetical protein
MDQDCLGHLFVENWVASKHGVVWSVPGADLAGPTNARREIDVLGISRTELIVAEVKNRSSGFGGNAVRDAAVLATALRAGRLILACLDVWEQALRNDAHIQARRSFQGEIDMLDSRQLLG